MSSIRIIGAGLAGSEAAWQCARRNIAVELCEMRPVRSTPAHQTGNFAELVCSNSLKSDSENTAPWLLKEEMRRSGSLLLKIARDCAVPAGHALAVDREAFAAEVTRTLSREPLIDIRREEVTDVHHDQVTIIATGPLTSDALSAEIARLSGDTHLYFYDSISPIVEADSIDMAKVYLAARYDKGTADYINCPMSRGEYDRFYDALIEAESVEERDWEKLNYFESCLPIEEIARRGRDTLRFGPMKPVGLRDPRTGRMPYAVVQLRQENLRADSYNLVGFQNHLKFGDQARVLRLIPGLENVRFLRYGHVPWMNPEAPRLERTQAMAAQLVQSLRAAVPAAKRVLHLRDQMEHSVSRTYRSVGWLARDREGWRIRTGATVPNQGDLWVVVPLESKRGEWRKVGTIAGGKLVVDPRD